MEPSLSVPHTTMAVFIISIPLMVLALALAVVPLIVTSHSVQRERGQESISQPEPSPHRILVDAARS